MTNLYWKIQGYWYKTITMPIYQRLYDSKIPICQGASGPCFKLGKRRRHCTAYPDEESNWKTQCKSCFDEEEDYWIERWQDYYSGLL